MKRFTFRSRHAAVLLLVASVLLYSADYLIFGHTPDILSGFLGNLAFLPIYVLIVTLVIERVIRVRERQVIRQKLNMVIGVFFSEVGTRLLRHLAGFMGDAGELAQQLKVTPEWQARDFDRAAAFLAGYHPRVDSRIGDLTGLKHSLMGKRGFMLALLENPNLLEHDEFTELLWAVFHLVEELDARVELGGLEESDLNHLSGDIRRAFGHLLSAWVAYMRHLQSDYPYLFSLAVRMNPLDPEARPEVA